MFHYNRKSRTWSIRKDDGSVQKQCPNSLCDGNCPLCGPVLQSNPSSSSSKQVKRRHHHHLPLKVLRYDCLLLSRETDECTGLYSTLEREVLLFTRPRPVPDAALLRQLPHTKQEISMTMMNTNQKRFVSGKFVVVNEQPSKSKEIEKDWQRIWKRISLILKKNICKISRQENRIEYRFGTFSLDAIAAFCDLHPSRLQSCTNPVVCYELHQGID